MNIREKILSIFKRKDKSVREISKETSLPKSTVHHNLTQTKVRQQVSGSEFWDTEEGYRWSIKLVVSTIYFFGVKGGFGAGKLKDFFEILNLSTHIGISETTILKIIKQVETLLIEYGDAKSKEIKSKVKEIELILGVDETWFEGMLLVCQELQSGFIFCEESAKNRSAETWDIMIKKILSVSE